MKSACLLLLMSIPLCTYAQTKKPPTTLRGILLEQLRTTHNQEDWFAPASIAVEGLTAEQAKWTPGNGNHSVGQLAYHLWFWDTRSLEKFTGKKLLSYDGNNNETFNDFTPAQWNDLVKKLNQVMSDWEEAVQNCGDKKLAANASLIEHVAEHNAYHIGQIVYVRKLEGVWDASKGVK